MAFLNTTPHDLVLKRADGSLFGVRPAVELIQSAFRVAPERAPEALEPIDGIAAARYVPQTRLSDLISDVVINDDTVILASTMTADALWHRYQNLPKSEDCASFSDMLTNMFVGKRLRLAVPYTGPDASRCLRERGQVQWVAELIVYG